MIHTTPIAANDQTPAATIEHDVARLMTALTRLLVGRRGDPHGPAFEATMMVMTGAPLTGAGLLWLADLARANVRHVVHLSFEPDRAIPRVAFAHHGGEAVCVYEHCFLALRPGEQRVAIVPDSFADGAFQLSANLRMKRRRAPAGFDATMPLMVRAYERFDRLFAAAVPDDARRPIRVSGGG